MSTPPRSASSAALARASPPSAVVRSAWTNSTPSMGSSVPRAAVITLGAAGQEPVDGGAAQTLGAAADEHALAGELGRISLAGHAVISSGFDGVAFEGEAVGEADRAARKVAMGGAFDDDLTVLVAQTVSGVKIAFTATTALFEQAIGFQRGRSKTVAVVAEDGVRRERLQHAVDIEAGRWPPHRRRSEVEVRAASVLSCLLALAAGRLRSLPAKLAMDRSRDNRDTTERLITKIGTMAHSSSDGTGRRPHGRPAGQVPRGGA